VRLYNKFVKEDLEMARKIERRRIVAAILTTGAVLIGAYILYIALYFAFIPEGSL